MSRSHSRAIPELISLFSCSFTLPATTGNGVLGEQTYFIPSSSDTAKRATVTQKSAFSKKHSPSSATRDILTGLDVTNPDHVASRLSTVTAGLESKNITGWIAVGAEDYQRYLDEARKDSHSVNEVIVKQFVVNVVPVKEGLEKSGEDVEEAVAEWERHIKNDLSFDIGGRSVSYQDVCYRSTEETCLSVRPEASGSQKIVTLFFAPSDLAQQYLNKLERFDLVNVEDSRALGFAKGLSFVPVSGSGTGYNPSIGTPYYSALSILSHPSSDVFATARGQIPAANASGRGRFPARSVKWLAYAVRALGTRFWILTKNADSADIFVVMLGYVLMHLTFVRLFLNMRKMGSSFWLPSATLISSIFGFLFALFAAYLLNVPVDLIQLSEALPFLVITIGFDKPFLLARAVFQNPEIKPVIAPAPAPVPDLSQTTSAQVAALGLNDFDVDVAALRELEKKGLSKGTSFAASPASAGIKSNGSAVNLNGYAHLVSDSPSNSHLINSNLDLSALDRGLAVHARIQREIAEAKRKSIRWAAPISAKYIVLSAVDKVGWPIVRDYAIEIAVLCVGAAFGIGGLREFCRLGKYCSHCLCLFAHIASCSCFDSRHGLSVSVHLLHGHFIRHGRNSSNQARSKTSAQTQGVRQRSSRFGIRRRRNLVILRFGRQTWPGVETVVLVSTQVISNRSQGLKICGHGRRCRHCQAREPYCATQTSVDHRILVLAFLEPVHHSDRANRSQTAYRAPLAPASIAHRNSSSHREELSRACFGTAFGHSGRMGSTSRAFHHRHRFRFWSP